MSNLVDLTEKNKGVKKNQTLLVLDFGSKHTQLFARKVRENNVFSVVRRYDTPSSEIQSGNYKAIVLAGTDIEKPNTLEILDSIKKISAESGIPFASLQESGNGLLFESVINEGGEKALSELLFNTLGLEKTWTMKNFTEDSIAEIKAQIGDKKVICALSGGVDSSVAAALVSKAVGKQLTCIFVDHGMLRKNEGDLVEQEFAKLFPLNLIRVNAGERFLGRLKGVEDPEKKRKIIGEEFIKVFEEEAKKLGEVDFLVQGTIYPDIIESGVDGAEVVKSHHNVGGLPEHMKLSLCEPLKDLFKQEVRLAGLEVGLPHHLVYRQPCPGPALGVRCIGEVNEGKIAILQEVDAIFREELEARGLSKELSQYFAVITNMFSVGVKEGRRTYDYVVALRAIKTEDFMTAKWAKIPLDDLEEISQKICENVTGVSRVVYDITSKPPATIEWE